MANSRNGDCITEVKKVSVDVDVFLASRHIGRSQANDNQNRSKSNTDHGIPFRTHTSESIHISTLNSNCIVPNQLQRSNLLQ